jgi:cobalt-precorrin-5B (C1)-methyltransferase
MQREQIATLKAFGYSNLAVLGHYWRMVSVIVGLGIVGGISIIGTSGIVIPYSAKAYTACISKSLDVASACGCETIVLSTGRRSEKYAQREFPLPEESFILAGDYIGYSLKNIARRGFRKAVIWGMVGKMSKLAAGNLYTNVSDSSVDIEL